MAVLSYVALLIAAAGFIAAAFAYIVDDRQASAILRTVGVAALALVFVPVIAAQFFGGPAPLRTFLGCVVLSIAAYAIRGRRRPRKEPPKKTGHAERTPVLPSPRSEE